METDSHAAHSHAADSHAAAATSLWRHADFLKLWAGQTVSVFGTMATRAALPLTAILVLDSGPLQQGLLQAAEAAPVLLVGVFAGVWVDRLRRRPAMIAADLGRAILLLSIPAAAMAGVLGMAQLYIVGALAAVLTTLFDSAYSAYLPTLVGRERVVDGNAKLSASASAAEMGGFAVGGALVQFLSGPVAIAIDAATFVCSALSLGWIRAPEPEPAPPEQRQSVMTELREGLAAVWRDPVLRALVGYSTTMRLAGGAFGAMYWLWAVRELHIAPALAGATAACGGVGSFVGAVLAGRTMRRFGVGATIVWGLGLGGALQLLVPLAHGPAAVLYLVGAQLLGDGMMTIGFVNEVSLRQAITPDRLLGRVSATANVLGVAAAPVGALAGGLLGAACGVRYAITAGAVGFVLSWLWLVTSPVRSLR